MNEDFLSNIKPGDEIVIRGYYGKYLANVYKVSRTQIITEKGERFRRRNGYKVGGSAWRFACICESSPEEMAVVQREIETKRIVGQIRDFKSWSTINLENLRKVLQIITEK